MKLVNFTELMRYIRRNNNVDIEILSNDKWYEVD